MLLPELGGDSPRHAFSVPPLSSVKRGDGAYDPGVPMVPLPADGHLLAGTRRGGTVAGLRMISISISRYSCRKVMP